MVDRCAFALNYSPETDEYRDEIIAELNERYEEISSQHPWMFLIRRETLTLKASIEGSSADRVTIDTATNPYLVVAVGGTDFPLGINGQTFIGPDDNRYTIVRRLNAGNILVEPQFNADFTGDTSWSIDYERYAYPPFATEVLGLSSREDDRGKLRYYSWNAEEKLFLDKDRVGNSDFYIEDEHLMLDPPEKGATIGETVAIGQLTAGITYQYVYTITGKGLESPPSDVLEFEVTAKKGIKISDLPDLHDPDGPYERGYRKKVYRRNKTNEGRWVLLSSVDSDATDFNDTGLINPSLDVDDIFYEYGPRPYHRVWMTAGGDIELEVRYQLRPRRMQSDTDTPMWPVAYHKLIYYEAMVNLALSHGMPQQSTVWERRADKLMNQMKSRFLTRRDRRYVRKSFYRNRYEEEERFGVPRKI
jgi:hypothetical protein